MIAMDTERAQLVGFVYAPLVLQETLVTLVLQGSGFTLTVSQVCYISK